MTPLRRWSVTALVTVAVVASPLLPRLLPASEPDVGVAELLARVDRSPEQGWSGYVETAGALQLPAAGDLDDLGGLLGEQTRMRVWWRGPDEWRVDRLLTAGESDLLHRGDQTLSYSYEAQDATISTDPDIRLPRTSDVLPNELARHLLDGLDAEDLTTLPARRVGGTSAAGLRLDGQRIAPGETTIARVDLWVDPATGVPLLVEVYALGAETPAITSEVLDYTAGDPGAARTSFTPTADTEVRVEEQLDIAAAANQYAPLDPPSSAAGLSGTDDSRGAVGVYGSGLTQLIAIPLRGSEAGPLREQIAVTPGAESDPDSIGVRVGPLGILLTGRADDGGWLLGGTLTQPVLARAARDVAAGAVDTEEDER